MDPILEKVQEAVTLIKDLSEADELKLLAFGLATADLEAAEDLRDKLIVETA